MVLILLAGGLVLSLVLPIFLARTRQARGRLLGMLVGLYLMTIGLVGAVGLVYLAVVDGRTGIRRNSLSAVFAFADQPVLATVTLLVSLLCAGTFVVCGFLLFKGARDGTLGA